MDWIKIIGGLGVNLWPLYVEVLVKHEEIGMR